MEYLHDKPVPPVVEFLLSKQGDTDERREQLLLSFYYGGCKVVLCRTPEGAAIGGHGDSVAVGKALRGLKGTELAKSPVEVHQPVSFDMYLSSYMLSRPQSAPLATMQFVLG